MELLKKWNSAHLLFIQVLVVLVMYGYNVAPEISHNVAQILLNQTFWTDSQTADQRQTAIQRVIALMQLSGNGKNGRLSVSSHSSCNMIPALIQADFYRRRQNYPLMLSWLTLAATSAPYPEIQRSIMLPYLIDIDADGNIVLPWKSYGWNFRPDSKADAVLQYGANESIILSYENTPYVRDKMIYSWSQTLQLSYWDRLNLNIKVKSGSYLTVESHSSQIRRHIEYLSGDGLWHEYNFDFENENYLRFIHLSLGEPEDTSAVKYQLEAKPVVLQVAENVKECG